MNIDKTTNKQHEAEIKTLIKDLGNKNGVIRRNTRESLKPFGHTAVDYLSELLVNKKKIIRWEAVKTLVEIHDPHSGPLFLLAVKDKAPGVRWLGAEGLISLGKSGVITVLEGLISNPDSLYIRQAAHHVLKEYSKFNPSPELDGLLDTLKRADYEFYSPIAALKYLRKLGLRNKRSN
jgi:HEAT repeat protein